MNRQGTSPWTDERLERVRALWLKGDSALTISRAVYEHGWRPSRNAVIGVAHRHKWSKDGRAMPCKPKPRPAVLRPVRPAKSPPGAIHYRIENVRPPVPKPDDAFRPLPDTVPVLWTERAGWQCSWPVAGDGYSTMSCGARKRDGSTWCEVHHALGRDGKRAA